MNQDGEGFSIGGFAPGSAILDGEVAGQVHPAKAWIADGNQIVEFEGSSESIMLQVA